MTMPRSAFLATILTAPEAARRDAAPGLVPPTCFTVERRADATRGGKPTTGARDMVTGMASAGREVLGAGRRSPVPLRWVLRQRSEPSLLVSAPASSFLAPVPAARPQHTTKHANRTRRPSTARCPRARGGAGAVLCNPERPALVKKTTTSSRSLPRLSLIPKEFKKIVLLAPY